MIIRRWCVMALALALLDNQTVNALAAAEAIKYHTDCKLDSDTAENSLNPYNPKYDPRESTNYSAFSPYLRANDPNYDQTMCFQSNNFDSDGALGRDPHGDQNIASYKTPGNEWLACQSSGTISCLHINSSFAHMLYKQVPGEGQAEISVDAAKLLANDLDYGRGVSFSQQDLIQFVRNPNKIFLQSNFKPGIVAYKLDSIQLDTNGKGDPKVITVGDNDAKGEDRFDNDATHSSFQYLYSIPGKDPYHSRIWGKFDWRNFAVIKANYGYDDSNIQILNSAEIMLPTTIVLGQTPTIPHNVLVGRLPGETGVRTVLAGIVIGLLHGYFTQALGVAVLPFGFVGSIPVWAITGTLALVCVAAAGPTIWYSITGEKTESIRVTLETVIDSTISPKPLITRMSGRIELGNIVSPFQSVPIDENCSKHTALSMPLTLTLTPDKTYGYSKYKSAWQLDADKKNAITIEPDPKDLEALNAKYLDLSPQFIEGHSFLTGSITATAGFNMKSPPDPAVTIKFKYKRVMDREMVEVVGAGRQSATP